MTDDCRDLKGILHHAHVKVTTREPARGEQPLLSVDAPLSATTVVALGLATAGEMARFTKAEPEAKTVIREFLGNLVGEFDRECRRDGPHSSGRTQVN